MSWMKSNSNFILLANMYILPRFWYNLFAMRLPGARWRSGLACKFGWGTAGVDVKQRWSSFRSWEWSCLLSRRQWRQKQRRKRECFLCLSQCRLWFQECKKIHGAYKRPNVINFPEEASCRASNSFVARSKHITVLAGARIQAWLHRLPSSGTCFTPSKSARFQFPSQLT